jgi:hypothetical protein
LRLVLGLKWDLFKTSRLGSNTKKWQQAFNACCQPVNSNWVIVVIQPSIISPHPLIRLNHQSGKRAGGEGGVGGKPKPGVMLNLLKDLL